MTYTVEFPAWFDLMDDAHLPAKGYFEGLAIHADGRTYLPSFYDPARLAQECDGELHGGGKAFCVANLVVLNELSKEAILAAIAFLASRDFAPLRAEPKVPGNRRRATGSA